MIAQETSCEHPSATVAFEPVGSGVYVADALSPARCAAIVNEFRGHDQWKAAKITRYEYDEATGAGQMRVVLDPARRIAERVHFADVDLADYPAAGVFFDFVRQQVLPFIHGEYGLATEQFGEAEIVRYPPGGVFIRIPTPTNSSRTARSASSFTSTTASPEEKRAFPHSITAAYPGPGGCCCSRPTCCTAAKPYAMVKSRSSCCGCSTRATSTSERALARPASRIRGAGCSLIDVGRYAGRPSSFFSWRLISALVCTLKWRSLPITVQNVLSLTIDSVSR